MVFMHFWLQEDNNHPLDVFDKTYLFFNVRWVIQFSHFHASILTGEFIVIFYSSTPTGCYTQQQSVVNLQMEKYMWIVSMTSQMLLVLWHVLSWDAVRENCLLNCYSKLLERNDSQDLDQIVFYHSKLLWWNSCQSQCDWITILLNITLMRCNCLNAQIKKGRT